MREYNAHQKTPRTKMSQDAITNATRLYMYSMLIEHEERKGDRLCLKNPSILKFMSHIHTLFPSSKVRLHGARSARSNHLHDDQIKAQAHLKQCSIEEGVLGSVQSCNPQTMPWARSTNVHDDQLRASGFEEHDASCGQVSWHLVDQRLSPSRGLCGQ